MSFLMGKVTEVAFKEATNKIKSMIEAINFFRQTEVVVGIPEDAAGGHDGISNAELLYLHENGVPSRNIPPRPVLKPAIANPETKGQIQTLLKDAAKAAFLHGDQMACEQCFHKAGMVGRDACKKWIADGSHLAPNAPATVARKGSSTPLIDTGQMMNAITYSVRNKKSKKAVGSSAQIGAGMTPKQAKR